MLHFKIGRKKSDTVLTSEKYASVLSQTGCCTLFIIKELPCHLLCTQAVWNDKAEQETRWRIVCFCQGGYENCLSFPCWCISSEVRCRSSSDSYMNIQKLVTLLQQRDSFRWEMSVSPSGHSIAVVPCPANPSVPLEQWEYRVICGLELHFSWHHSPEQYNNDESFSFQKKRFIQTNKKTKKNLLSAQNVRMQSA